MREKIRDRERLQHILDTCNVLIENKDKCSHEEIENDPIRYFGFVKHVEIIGEATYKLTKEFRESHPEIEWDLIEGMRHILVHGYYQIRPQQLWKTIDNDIVALKPYIERYLDEMEQ